MSRVSNTSSTRRKRLELARRIGCALSQSSARHRSRMRATLGGMLATLLVASVGWTSPANAAEEETGPFSWKEPLLCPSMLPHPGPPWNITVMVPNNFHVPKWNGVAGTVTFNAIAQRLDGSMPPVLVGQGYYNPFPSTAYDQDTRWSWQSDRSSGKGGIFTECGRFYWLWGASSYTYIWTGDPLIGFAIPVGDDADDERVSPGGENGCPEGEVLYETFNYWYDLLGNYHEEITGHFCAPAWEE